MWPLKGRLASATQHQLKESRLPNAAQRKTVMGRGLEKLKRTNVSTEIKALKKVIPIM